MFPGQFHRVVHRNLSKKIAWHGTRVDAHTKEDVVHIAHLSEEVNGELRENRTEEFLHLLVVKIYRATSIDDDFRDLVGSQSQFQYVAAHHAGSASDENSFTQGPMLFG